MRYGSSYGTRRIPVIIPESCCEDPAHGQEEHPGDEAEPPPAAWSGRFVKIRKQSFQSGKDRVTSRSYYNLSINSLTYIFVLPIGSWTFRGFRFILPGDPLSRPT